MKKTILTFALMLTAMTAGAKIYQPGDDLNYEYDDENRTATVVQERATYKTDVSGYHIAYYNTYSGDIVIPETAPNGYTVVAIGNSAFSRCNDSRLYELNGITAPTITSITIPKTVKTIGNDAFWFCDQLTSFTIPATVEEIGNRVFDYSSITSLTIEDADAPLTIGGGGLTSRNVFGTGFTSPCTVYVGRDITAKSADNPGPFQFAKNITDITYGPKVTKLNKKEVWRSTSIKTVTILSTQITTVPESAFGQCAALETVVLPASINHVADVAFFEDTALKAIYANPMTPPTCGTQVFDKVDKQACTLFVPLGSLEDYKAAPVWKEFFNIEEMAETKCATPTAVLEDGHVKFSSATKGVTFHYEYSYPEDGSGKGDEFAVTQTITVSVYATRPGLEDSDVAVYELTIAGGGSSNGDVNGDGAVNVADISAVITIMAGN